MTSATPPPWLSTLAKAVTPLIMPTEILSPLGCHYHHAEDIWEVTIFASRTEVIGGEHDGRRIPCRFVLDVGGVISLFSDIHSVEWQAMSQGSDDEVGANLAVEGIYHGEHVRLRIPAEAPERFEAGRYANVYEMRFIDAW